MDDIILDPTEIAREYVRTWFILDLISSIPLDYVLFAFRAYEHGDRAEQLVHAGKLINCYFMLSIVCLFLRPFSAMQ